MTVIKKKRILVRFPKHYPLAEACRIIREWDPKIIKCGHVEGIPYVYAESKETQFDRKVAKLLKQGVVFEESVYMPKFDDDVVEPEMPEPNEQPRAANVDISDTVISQILNELNNLKKDNAEFKKDIAELRADNNKKGKEIARLNRDIEEIVDYYRKSEADATQQTSIESVIRSITPTPKRAVSPKPQRKSPTPKRKSPSPKRDKTPAPVRAPSPSPTPARGSSSKESKSNEKAVEEPPKAVEKALIARKKTPELPKPVDAEERYASPFDNFKVERGISVQGNRLAYKPFGDTINFGTGKYKTFANAYAAAIDLKFAVEQKEVKNQDEAKKFVDNWIKENVK
jgi:hypothetical protein